LSRRVDVARTSFGRQEQFGRQDQFWTTGNPRFFSRPVIARLARFRNNLGPCKSLLGDRRAPARQKDVFSTRSTVETRKFQFVSILC